MTNDNKQPDVLPCPFCGGVPEIRRQVNDHTKSRKVIIKCPNCRIQRTDAAIRNNMDWLENVALQNWNRRAALQSPSVANDGWRKAADIFTDFISMSQEEFIDKYGAANPKYVYLAMVDHVGDANGMIDQSPQQQEQKHGSAGSSPLDSSGEAVYAGCDMASGPDRTGEFVTSSTQALSMEASRELKVAVSDLRKAAYEFGQVESADNYNLMMEAQRRLFSVVLSDSTFTPTPSESQAGTTQEAVAWVEVKDAHEGPYDFHGKELLPRGKHNLYLAPPTSTAIAAMVIHKVTDKVGSWLRSAEIRLADVDTRTDEIKYQGIVDELRGLLTELRALTPANAEAELEALMIEATKHGMSYEEANHEAGTGNMHEAASAIVRCVLDEKGE